MASAIGPLHCPQRALHSVTYTRPYGLPFGWFGDGSGDRATSHSTTIDQFVMKPICLTVHINGHWFASTIGFSKLAHQILSSGDQVGMLVSLLRKTINTAPKFLYFIDARRCALQDIASFECAGNGTLKCTSKVNGLASMAEMGMTDSDDMRQAHRTKLLLLLLIKINDDGGRKMHCTCPIICP